MRLGICKSEITAVKPAFIEGRNKTYGLEKEL